MISQFTQITQIIKSSFFVVRPIPISYGIVDSIGSKFKSLLFFSAIFCIMECCVICPTYNTSIKCFFITGTFNKGRVGT